MKLLRNTILILIMTSFVQMEHASASCSQRLKDKIENQKILLQASLSIVAPTLVGISLAPVLGPAYIIGFGAGGIVAIGISISYAQKIKKIEVLEARYDSITFGRVFRKMIKQNNVLGPEKSRKNIRQIIEEADQNESLCPNERTYSIRKIKKYVKKILNKKLEQENINGF